MKHNLKKRVFAIVLAVLMVFGCMSDSSFGTMAASLDGTVSGNDALDTLPMSVSGNDSNDGEGKSSVSGNETSVSGNDAGNQGSTFILSYNGNTEGFATSTEVVERINELNSETNQYVIECGSTALTADTLWETLPETAGKITFCPKSGVSDAFVYMGAVQATYPVVINVDTSLTTDGYNLSEVYVSDVFFGVNKGVFRSLLLSAGAYVMARDLVSIDFLSVAGSASELTLTKCYDSPESTIPVSIGKYNIGQIAIIGDGIFKVSSNDCSDGETIFTTGTDLSLNQISYRLSNNMNLVKNDNRDGTYSFVAVAQEDKTPMFSLSYGNVVEEYASYDEVLAKMNELNNANNIYHITCLGQQNTLNALPEKAKKVILSVDTSGGAYSVWLNASTKNYPIETDAELYITGNQSIGKVTALSNSRVVLMGSSVDELNVDNARYFDVYRTSTVGKLTISANTNVYIGAPVEISEVVYSSSNANNTYPSWNIGESSYLDDNQENFIYTYGKIKLGKLTLGSTTQYLDIYCGGKVNENDSVVLEVANYTSAWNQVTVQPDWYAHDNGYNLVKTENADQSFSYAWVKDTVAKFKLSYGETEKEFVTLTSLWEEMNTLDNSNNDYVITVLKGVGNLEGDSYKNYTINGLPAANSISFVAEEDFYGEIEIYGYGGFVPETLNFEKIRVRLTDLEASNVTVQESTLYFHEGVKIEQLTSDIKSQLTIYDRMEIGKLICEGEGYFNGISIGTSDKWDDDEQAWVDTIGSLKVGELDAKNVSILSVSPPYGIQEEYDMLEFDKSNDVDKVRINAWFNDSKYTVVKSIRDNGSVVFTYKKDVPKFVVTKANGDEFGTYATWNDLLAAFNTSGDVKEEYVITIKHGAEISSLMPSKAKKVTIKGDSNYTLPDVYVNASSISQFVDMEIENVYFVNKTTWQLLTWNVNGKNLVLNGENYFSKILGTKGTLTVNGYASIGSLQDFSKVVVPDTTTLRLYDAVSAITDLYLDGELEVFGNKAVSLTNIVAGDDAQIFYACQGTVNQNVTITGTITDEDGNPGSVALRRSAYTYDDYGYSTIEISNFAVGTNLLTAANCTTDQFVLDGDKMTCYKTGNVLYAGMEALELYDADDNRIGVYAKWADIVSVINTRADKTADYKVVLLEDFNVGGVLTMPTAGQYASITIASDSETETRELLYTGNITLTGNLTIDQNVLLQPITTAGADTKGSIAIGLNTITLKEDNSALNGISGQGGVVIGQGVTVTISGAVSAGEVTLEDGSTLTVNGSMTVKNIHTVDSTALTCTGAVSVSDNMELNGDINVTSLIGKSGLLTVNDNARVGTLQSFKTVTIPDNANLHVYNTVSGITNLELDGVLAISSKNAVTLTNIIAGENATIAYMCEGTVNQNVTISGDITGGTVKIERWEMRTEDNGAYSEEKTNFIVGTKLLTATKATSDKFTLDGDKMTCYKTGNVLYAGMEALELYDADDNRIGVYAKWADIVSVINTRADKTADYKVVLLADFNVGGVLTMPTAGQYASITIASDSETETRELLYTGNITLTGNLTIDQNVLLQPITAAGVNTRGAVVTGVNTITLKEDSNAFSTINGQGSIVIGQEAAVNVSGAINVGNITLEEGSTFTVVGNLITKELNICDGTTLNCKGTVNVSTKLTRAAGEEDATLIFTEKKSVAIQDTLLEGAPVVIKVQSATGETVTLAAGTVLFTTAGNTYANQYVLLDKAGEESAIYRSGNNIKVSGAEAPIELFIGEEENAPSLGTYGSLADVKTEIDRRKDKTATYVIDVNEDVLVSGAVPMPTAGTFEKLVFTGAKIQTTSATVTLTGNTEFRNELVKVKSLTDLTPQAITINIGKYTFTIDEGYEIEKLAGVSGQAGSVLKIKAGVNQEISGNITGIEKLALYGTLSAWGDITVTDVEAGENGLLKYDLGKKITINGVVKDGKLTLAPYQNGAEVTSYIEGMTVIDVATKADVQSFVLIPETAMQFYRDITAIKLGNPVITVIKKDADEQPTFVRFNDAVTYIDNQGEGFYTIQLDGNVPSAGALNMPKGTGKDIYIAGKDGEKHTLNFTGAITIDGANVEISGINMNNATAAGAAVTLKNGAGLALSNTAVNTVTAPAGTTVILEDGAVINGALSGASDLYIDEDAHIRFKNVVTVKNLILDGTSAELRVLKGKLITVSGAVNIGDGAYILINQVDADDQLADIAVNTSMISAASATTAQFKTDNIMTGTTDVKWLLTKSGNIIKTAKLLAYAYPEDGRVIDEDHQFASFNDAKEYVDKQDESYVIELLDADMSADLSILPENLVAIIKSESTSVQSIILQTAQNITLGANLKVDSVVITASGKTLDAAGNELELCNYAGITVAKVVGLEKITIGNGTVTVTGSTGNQINNVEMNGTGTMKCPAYSGFVSATE